MVVCRPTYIVVTSSKDRLNSSLVSREFPSCCSSASFVGEQSSLKVDSEGEVDAEFIIAPDFMCA